MAEFVDLLSPETVVSGLTAMNKKALLTQLGGIAGTAFGLDPDDVTSRLIDRERLGSTGFGGGVAIPHCRLPGLTRVRGAFARLERSVDYAAVDELPVDLVFLLLSPEAAGPAHLKALARVSRQMRDTDFAAKLRGAGSRDALYALLAGIDARDAA